MTPSPRPSTGQSPTEADPPAVPRRSLPLLAAGTAALVFAVVIALLAFRLGAVSVAADAESTPSASPSSSETAAPTVADVYASVAASVVVVTTAGGSLGAGFIAAEDGTILTAGHVVDDGSAITVTFADGTEASAAVTAADSATDVASLMPSAFPEVLVPATLGGGAEVGDEVIAIGNPLGLRYSVSSGVVSGLDRSGRTEAGEVEGLIQFDAAVNPGSSGGPLLDAEGTVVGIVVAILDPGGDEAFAGIGLAVPIGTAVGSGSGGDGPQL